MALKRKLTKAAYEKLSEDLQKEYKEKDGSYVLDVDGENEDGGEEAKELKRAKDREVQKRKDAEKERDELKEQLEGITDKDARKKGDIETLEKSWNTKLEKVTKDFTDKLAAKDKFIQAALIDNKALEIASKISTAPKVILPHIKARLVADLDGDNPTTKVLDKDGKPSAMNLDELTQEFVANPDFAGIITGSKASGGGASRSNPTNRTGGASAGGDTKPTNLADLSDADFGARLKAQREQRQGNV